MTVGVLGQAFFFSDVAFMGNANQVASGGGGSCTVNTGNIFNESFEGTGYENSWTETDAPDEDYALPGTSPCSGLGSQGLRANYSGTTLYARYDFTGNDTTTLYHRIYFYVASESLGNNDYSVIYQCSEETNPSSARRLQICVGQIAGVLSAWGQSTTSSSVQTISLNTWYRAEAMSVNNAATSEFKLFDSSGSQIGSTSTFTTGNYWSRYIYVGRSYGAGTLATDVTVDGVGVSTSGYLGQ